MEKFKKYAKWLVPAGFVGIGILFLACMVGYSFSALICFALALLISLYYLLDILQKKSLTTAKVLRLILTALVCIGVAAATVTEALVIRASHGEPQRSSEYIVVLGAGLHGNTPSRSLHQRILTAEKYLKAHPDALCIVSGGQGSGEDMTEAQCMKERLTALGISADRIWMEDKSTSTEENLRFSLKLLEEKTGAKPRMLGIISSEYHLFRAGLYAKSCGVESFGIPAETDILALRINYYLREIGGVWYYLLFGGNT